MGLLAPRATLPQSRQYRATAQESPEGHPEKVRRLTTDAIGLAIIIVTCFAMIGLTNLQRIFSLMGADEEILNLISDYMILWFLGVGLLGIPIVSNGAIRATGDTKSPALIMIIAGLLNIVWDPFLIFGIGSFPRLELRGAAFETVIFCCHTMDLR